MANRMKPSTETAPIKIVVSWIKVRPNITTVEAPTPAMTTGRRPMRSETTPIMGAATMPPMNRQVMTSPVFKGSKPRSLTR